jgi:hypothetical protein
MRLLCIFSAVQLAVGVGCASAAHLQPVTSKEWLAVLNDWLGHSRFSEPHSCAAVVVARTHAPPRYREGTPLVHALDVYERAICPTGNVWAVRDGMTNRQVASTAGAPVPWLSGPRCWFYRAKKTGTSIDGLGFCFASGRVTQIKTAVHG